MKNLATCLVALTSGALSGWAFTPDHWPLVLRLLTGIVPAVIGWAIWLVATNPPAKKKAYIPPTIEEEV